MRGEKKVYIATCTNNTNKIQFLTFLSKLDLRDGERSKRLTDMEIRFCFIVVFCFRTVCRAVELLFKFDLN